MGIMWPQAVFGSPQFDEVCMAIVSYTFKISLAHPDCRRLWVVSQAWSIQRLQNWFFAASPLSMQHLRLRAKTGQLRARIMCLSKVAYLSVSCCFHTIAH